MRSARLREPAANAPHYERRRPEQTPLYRLAQQHCEMFAAKVRGLPSTEMKKLHGLDYEKGGDDAPIPLEIISHTQ